jgi:hypothetical protein
MKHTKVQSRSVQECVFAAPENVPGGGMIRRSLWNAMRKVEMALTESSLKTPKKLDDDGGSLATCFPSAFARRIWI